MKLINLLFLLSLIMFISCSDKDEIDHNTVDKIEKRQLIHEDGPGWSPCEISDLTIYVPENCNELYTQAFQNAVNNFNNVPNTGINIQIISDSETADIVASCYSQTDFLVGGSVGSDLESDGKSTSMFINHDLDLSLADCEEEIDLCGATGIIMHEIMHNIGFFHDGDENAPAVLVEGTINGDPNTIIKDGEELDWCNLICEFSDFDIIALQEIYPCGCYPLPTSNKSDFICEVGEIKTFCAPEAADLLGWELPDNLSLVTLNGNCITVQVESLEPTSELIAHLANNTCDYTFTINLNVPDDPEFDIVWLDPVCIGDVVSFFIEPLSINQNLYVEDWFVQSGGLNIMASNSVKATAEAESSGKARICARVANQCSVSVVRCSTVWIKPESDCNGDGGPWNPK